MWGGVIYGGLFKIGNKDLKFKLFMFMLFLCKKNIMQTLYLPFNSQLTSRIHSAVQELMDDDI